MNNYLSTKILAVVFTRGISFSIWDKIGLLEREILIYKKLSTVFDKIYFFTYGELEDIKYQKLFSENVYIIRKPRYIPNSLYVFLMPFIKNKIFKKVDFIKTNQMDGSWAAVIAKKIFNKKLIVRCGYEWLSFVILGKRSRFKILIAYIVELISYKSADHIIITSVSDKDFIVSKFNINPNKISVISNYIDTDLFKPRKGEDKTRSIFFVGRIEPQKNLAFLVESLRGLDIELIIAGEGSLREEIEQLAQGYGVKITFLGNVSQKIIPDLINKSRIFALPSLYEGNPKVILEAMSCGASVVATRVQGIDSVITDGVNGLLADLGNHYEMRENILKILNDEVFAQNLGLNARKKILENSSLDFVFNAEKSIYEILG